VGGRETLRAEARIVAATNRDLEGMVREGGFRADLYYRLSVVTIALPALRERPEDIPLLVEHLLRRVALRVGRRVEGVSRSALLRLVEHPWPGNVRELENVLTRAVIRASGGVVGRDDLPPLAAPEGRPGGEDLRPRTLAEVERVHIERMLRVAQGNRGRACDLLGITRPTLRRKMREYGLQSA
jgi:two-component system response regulator AtoC